MIIFAWDGFFREIMKHSLSSFSVLVYANTPYVSRERENARNKDVS